MYKVERRQLFMLTLPGLWLIAAFFVGSGASVLAWNGSTAFAAANSVVAKSDRSCTGTLHTPSFGSAVVIDGSEVICSNITAFGGPVVIRGKVHGNIVSFGGDVVIDGTVDGDVNLYGGNITLQNGAHVNGDIHICGGHWVQGQSLLLHGNILDCPKSPDQILSRDGSLGFVFWSILTWIAVGTLLTSLLPEHVMLVRTTVKSKMRRSLVLGLLSLLLAPIVLLILVALIISIPLAIIVAIGLVAAWALGTIAVGWLLGDYILKKLVPQHNTRLMQVVVGLTVLVLAESLPYIGLLISIGAGMVGLGAVFLSRFGTRLYSQPKQPLVL